MARKIEARRRDSLQKAVHDGMMAVFPHARPGMKVECVDLVFAKEGVRAPRIGNVYTIRELRRGLWLSWTVGFTLVEIINEVDPEEGSEPFFSADAFEILTDEEAERMQRELADLDEEAILQSLARLSAEEE
jgi:hypothetical protein